ncbi:MAG: hypothetical protein AAF648_06930 [Pseudomonadota bacterium]
MLATITRATPNEFGDVAQFWYRVYVREMGRLVDDPNTKHTTAEVQDPLIAFSTTWIARDETQRIVGTLMCTCARNGRLGKYETLYGFDRLSPEKRACASITTKLMVDARFRSSRLGLKLASSGYSWLVDQGMQFDYIDCNDHLVPFFNRLGYLPHLGRITHPDYGAVNSMVVPLTDTAHLERVKSPLLAAHRRRNRSSQKHEKRSLTNAVA